MSDTPITFVEYDPEWPARYTAEKARITDAIGHWLNRVEHIGSTAVEGLAAKPIIDITAAIDNWE